MFAPVRSGIHTVVRRVAVVGLGVAPLALVGCADDQAGARGLAGEPSTMQVCLVNNSSSPVPFGLDEQGQVLLVPGTQLCQWSEGVETLADILDNVRKVVVLLPHDNLPAGPVNAQIFARRYATVQVSAGQTTQSPDVPGLTLSCGGASCVKVMLTISADFR